MGIDRAPAAGRRRADERDQSGALGLGTVTHFYGHFESLLKDYVVQPYPVRQNYNDEQDRFGQVARLWDKIYRARQRRVEGLSRGAPEARDVPSIRR